jgi:hypothetical protein
MTMIDAIITGNARGQRRRCALYGKEAIFEPLDVCFNALRAAPQRLWIPGIRLVERPTPSKMLNIAGGGRQRAIHLGNLG